MVQSDGGFIRISDGDDVVTSAPSGEAGRTPLRKLTGLQQVKLTQYLDDALLSLERDVNKRTDPSSPIPTLPRLISRLKPIFNLIMAIPPVDPTTYVRIQYLLRFTSGLREYISGYSITGEGVIEEASSASRRRHEHSRKTVSKASIAIARRNLEDLLEFLYELDLGWQTVLAGDVWTRRNGTIRYASDNDQILLGKAVSITDKIRLRSSILSIRERVLSWAERQSYQLTGEARTNMVEAESETDISALEDEVDESTEGKSRDTGSLKWKADIVRSMNGTLNALAL